MLHRILTGMLLLLLAMEVNANQAPTVSLGTPTANASFTAPANIQLTANATDTDGSIAQVAFYEGTTLLGTVTTAPYVLDWNNVAIGSYTLSAIATDNLGLTAVSAPVQITVTSAAAQVYYIHTDQLNTPRLITDQHNTPVWRWDNTDPFANNPVNDDPNNTGNHFTFNQRFPGQYYDVETNTHYNYFRDYDPATGRYIESDPIGLAGGINTYAYVRGNPITRTDPMGLMDGCPTGMAPDENNICQPTPHEDPNAKVCFTAECAAGLPPTKEFPVSCGMKCNTMVGLICGPIAGATAETGPGAAGVWLACKAAVHGWCSALCSPPPNQCSAK